MFLNNYLLLQKIYKTSWQPAMLCVVRNCNLFQITMVLSACVLFPCLILRFCGVKV